MIQVWGVKTAEEACILVFARGAEEGAGVCCGK